MGTKSDPSPPPSPAVLRARECFRTPAPLRLWARPAIGPVEGPSQFPRRGIFQGHSGHDIPLQIPASLGMISSENIKQPQHGRPVYLRFCRKREILAEAAARLKPTSRLAARVREGLG